MFIIKRTISIFGPVTASSRHLELQTLVQSDPILVLQEHLFVYHGVLVCSVQRFLRSDFIRALAHRSLQCGRRISVDYQFVYLIPSMMTSYLPLRRLWRWVYSIGRVALTPCSNTPSCIHLLRKDPILTSR